jgi:hypothetical protein
MAPVREPRVKQIMALAVLGSFAGLAPAAAQAPMGWAGRNLVATGNRTNGRVAHVMRVWCHGTRPPRSM